MAEEELRLRFTIVGKPLAKERARTSPQYDKEGNIIIKNGKVAMKTKTPPNTKAWETYVSLIARQARTKIRMDTAPKSPVELGCIFFLPIPSSWSDKKKQKANEWLVPMTTRPDLSNLLKAIEDACEGILWHNDSQIVQYGTVDGTPTSKRYSDRPRVEVEVKYL
jgi:Holliday junction resolvase RusA-like endonuclease